MVYCAHLRSMAKLPGCPASVALKLTGHSMARRAASPKAAREARLQQRVAHAHVLPVYAYGSDGNTAFSATELAHCDLLRPLAAHPDGLHPKAALEIALQLALALEHCHGLGVAHCDVKAENVLLTKAFNRHGGNVAKLADFGLAVEFDPNRRAAVVTAGTLPYMPVESLRRKPHDPRSADIHQLGVLIYELLCGHLPFDVPDHKLNCRRAHVRSRASRPRFSHLVWVIVDPNVAPLVDAMLSNEWRQRPSASEVVAVLHSVVHADRAARRPACSDGVSRLIQRALDLD